MGPYMSKDWQYRQLYERGISMLPRDEDARLDARLLLEEVCGTNLQTLLVYPEKEVPVAQAEQYLSMVRRRAAGEPTAYILGRTEFMGLPFSVNSDVLIPEQDTEVLVETAVELGSRLLKDQQSRSSLRNTDREGSSVQGQSKSIDAFSSIGQTDQLNKAEGTSVFRVLDMCTGSGCILLSVLHYLRAAFPGADIQGTGCDLSSKALAVAKKNAENLGLRGCTAFLQGDLFAALDNCRGGKENIAAVDSRPSFITNENALQQADAGPAKYRFDMVVSNPPYIATDVINTLPAEVRCAEPHMALDGGADGLSFYRRLAQGIPKIAVQNGIIIVEIGYDQGESVPAILRNAGYRDIRLIRDYGGRDRVVTARTPVQV